MKSELVLCIEHMPMSRSTLGLRLLNLGSPYRLSLSLVFGKKEAPVPSKKGMWTSLMTRVQRLHDRRHLPHVLLEVGVFRIVYGEIWIVMCAVVATSPTPGVNHQLSIAASRRYSDALTLGICSPHSELSSLTMLLSVGDASNTEIKPNLGMDIDYHDKTEIVGLDTAQAPTDYVDTGSVPQTEQEHSSPSPLTPNLSPATWPHRPPPIRPTRATIRGRGIVSPISFAYIC